MWHRLSGGERAGLALAAVGLTIFAMRDANAATAAAVLPSGAAAPIIVPESNLPAAATAWYDQALSQLGFAGTFSERLVGFQGSRMTGILGTPAVSHLTPDTQQAIQSAIAAQSSPASTSGFGDAPRGGLRRMRF